MSDSPRTVAAQASLAVAQDFIGSVEAKDLDAVSRTLTADARQLFMHSRRTRTSDGVAAIVAGRTKGFCVADVKGRSEILAYTDALFDKFTPLVWRDHEWTVTQNGEEVFFHGEGDMVVARTGKRYKNNYVTRFDIEDGRIHCMAEYADAFMYAGLRVRPNGAEFRALLRAVKRMASFGQSSRSGR
jgi:ketosteroid isomerase-like protein